MKTIRSIPDALAFSLSKLYYAELAMRDHFISLEGKLNSASITLQLEEQAEGCENNLLKLERIFNYLMQDPVPGNLEAITQLVADTRDIVDLVENRYLKDVLLTGCIQNIQAVKISNYRIAYMLAAELELDTVVDLVQQILEQETEASQSLSHLFISRFNKYRKTADV
ncbi:MAG TPA: DUF892 family protein [Cyclobacteriaceae bacterium]|nr:ferritin-like domain-containing protein [Cyclobacteriaceae bacterium]HMV08442.1 DUF892 family protein [Cyclobacteriaceae bacterium]HMV91177.1 DUF892 family protein [Cyclobacteriaceae bacterium]HMX01215.1 DUF892 family protein [Cyclobacteriaceae bacterium]HMX50618.1 DUF892 family protein [Cyclobacteriaceae bacterium]